MSDCLLDTNVISETARQRPALRVMTWLAARSRLLVSSVSWFEIRRGIDVLPRSRRRQALEDWLQRWETSGLEVLAFDREAATEAARLEVESRRRGRSIEFRDLFVLGTARASGLVVATRNVSDFDGLGVEIFDPFTNT